MRSSLSVLPLAVALAGAACSSSAPNPFDKRPTLGFSATGSLRRSDFGISTYLPLIGDEVSIQIDAEFNQKTGG